MEKCMVKDNLCGQMEENTLECIQMIWNMEKENLDGQMEQDILGNLEKENNMEKEF